MVQSTAPGFWQIHPKSTLPTPPTPPTWSLSKLSSWGKHRHTHTHTKANSARQTNTNTDTQPHTYIFMYLSAWISPHPPSIFHLFTPLCSGRLQVGMAVAAGGISLFKVSHFQWPLRLGRKTKVKCEREDSGGACDEEKVRESNPRAQPRRRGDWHCWKQAARSGDGIKRRSQCDGGVCADNTRAGCTPHSLSVLS